MKKVKFTDGVINIKDGIKLIESTGIGYNENHDSEDDPEYYKYHDAYDTYVDDKEKNNG